MNILGNFKFYIFVHSVHKIKKEFFMEALIILSIFIVIVTGTVLS